ncbi:MAG: hypothetical protein HOI73_01110 [Alphaproteobacteria bacterium]|jgi:hypothetical protein|nr:hypothetical protein [Alphaproteobacteria bacterium]MDB0028215.1 hypothetical protein [Alphaproteobacteria bacterium]
MLITRTNVSRAPCRRCHILRVLLLMVLGVVLVALVAKESFALIGGIQPIMFGYLFAGLAVVTFIMKLGYYYYQKRQK